MSQEKTITTRTGMTVVIELESDPATGYGWQPTFDTSIMRLLHHENLPGGAAVGGAGMERFTFVALKPGESELRLVYKRPWEQAHIEERHFSIQVK